MSKRNLLYGLVIAVFFSTSCNKSRLNVDISEIKTEAEIIRFDQELLEMPADQGNFKKVVQELNIKYPDFFDLFTYRMIRIGGINDSLFFIDLKRFITDSMIVDAKTMVDAEFKNFRETEKEIKKSFKYFAYYYPEKPVPEIYTCISGFNQSVVIAENLIGVSLDKYLGTGCPYYSMMAIPQYKQQKMYKERIPVDMMYGWAKSEFIKSNKETNLLSYMIYEGKLLYFVDAMFPKMQDSIKIGYTAKQLDWCKQNEAQMWTTLVENKRLYSSHRMDVRRIIDDSPNTNGFPVESPGRAGVWIGWQIIRQYMEKHPEVSLQMLMDIDDSQMILNDSKYYPQ